jgi:nucleotide-binding universal stress UspA family protein
MSHKILCAVDGSAHSDRAVDLAAELAARLGSPLTICSVNVLLNTGRGPMTYAREDANVQALLKSAAQKATEAGAAPVDVAMITSREAAAGVVAYAEDGKYDMIVTGTGDKHGLSRLIIGSVAADIAGRAHCTVVIAR